MITVVKTPAKKKRKVPSVRDYKIFFDRMEEGTLRVDCEAQKVYTYYRKEWRELKCDLDDKRPNKVYLFVRVYHKGKRRCIALHRLIWMVHNGVESIPKGYDIGHEDDDSTNNDPMNLELEPSHVNQRRNSIPDDFSPEDDF